MIDGHALTLGRRRLGSLPYGRRGVTLYGTTGRCTCGWTERVNTAPTRGGSSACRRLWREHVRDALTEAWPGAQWWELMRRSSHRCQYVETGGACLRFATWRMAERGASARVLACTQHARMLGAMP